MKNYNRNNRSGKGSNRDYSRRDSGRPSMHQAVCDKCGKDCEVPFRPTGGKPIYCKDCFKNIEPKKSGGRGFQRFDFSDRKMYKAICDKCKKECEVPFRPTGGKPVYCKDCFGKDEKVGIKDSNQFNEQFALLNTKLDEILNTLVSSAVKAEPKKKEIPAKKKKTKPKKPVVKKKATKKK